jgi:hypothetical protein
MDMIIACLLLTLIELLPRNCCCCFALSRFNNNTMHESSHNLPRFTGHQHHARTLTSLSQCSINYLRYHLSASIYTEILCFSNSKHAVKPVLWALYCGNRSQKPPVSAYRCRLYFPRKAATSSLGYVDKAI